MAAISHQRISPCALSARSTALRACQLSAGIVVSLGFLSLPTAQGRNRQLLGNLSAPEGSVGAAIGAGVIRRNGKSWQTARITKVTNRGQAPQRDQSKRCIRVTRSQYRRRCLRSFCDEASNFDIFYGR